MSAQRHQIRGHGHRHRWFSVLSVALIGCLTLVSGATSTSSFAASRHHKAAGAVSTKSTRVNQNPREHIVWSRFIDVEFSAARIMLSRPNGRHKHALTHPGRGVVDTNPKVSPNGRRVAFERDFPDGTSKVGIVGIHGGSVHLLDLGCVDPCFADGQPTWTPHGQLFFQRVVGPFDSGNAASAVLWKSDLRGKHVKQISKPWTVGVVEDAWAQFAPAGYVVFVRLRLDTDSVAIFRMKRDGTDACRLTPWSLQADLPDVSPATSGPTKNLAVFETYGHGGPPAGKVSAIATAKATCSGHRQISYVTSSTSVPVWRFNPGWSPDGRHVAFVRFKSVNGDPVVHGDIHTARWNGQDRRRVSASPLFDFRPDWGPAPS